MTRKLTNVGFALAALTLLFLVVTSSAGFCVYREALDPMEEINTFPGQVLVVLNEGYTISDLDSINQELSASNIEYDTLSNIYNIKIPSDIDIDSAVAIYHSSPAVKAAGPNDAGFVQYTPNDPYLSNQWYLDYIEAKKAWEVTTGTGYIIIGIIDTGIDFDHPDLADNIISGYDFVNMETRPSWWHSWAIPIGDTVEWDDNPLDEFGHGTGVAGVAAAIGNNAEGIA